MNSPVIVKYMYFNDLCVVMGAYMTSQIPHLYSPYMHIGIVSIASVPHRFLQWGTTDAKNKDPSVENRELKGSPF